MQYIHTYTHTYEISSSRILFLQLESSLRFPQNLRSLDRHDDLFPCSRPFLENDCATRGPRKARGRETAADPERSIKDATRVKPVAHASRSNPFDLVSKGLINGANESERIHLQYGVNLIRKLISKLNSTLLTIR